MVPIGLSASIFHAMQGNVQGRAALMIASASVTTCGATSMFAGNISEDTMRKVFAALLAVSSISMMRA